MLLRSEFVLLPEEAPLRHGAVRVEGSQIAAVGSRSELIPLPGETVVELGDCVLAPGLINAHCHLDYTDFRGAISPGLGFAEWIRRINSLKHSFSPQDYLDSIAHGFELLMTTGTSSVLNILAVPELIPMLPSPPLRTWWFMELVDLRPRLNSDAEQAGMWQALSSELKGLSSVGVSPHAPYTASVTLYRLIQRFAEHAALPVQTHIAESVAEQEMFLYGKGELFEFLQSLGRDMSDCGQGTAFSHLAEYSVLKPNTFAVHMNYLQDYDWPLLEESGATVVHCPKCHSYFGHDPFPLEKMLLHGINVCLGTDSLASNNSLDLRSEIREVRRRHPRISGPVWLDMVTRNPARTLGLAGKLGEIRCGAVADLVAFSREGMRAADPYESLILSTEPPALLMVNGSVVFRS
jgi:cytosine/adenosine deaminase-related metal-dependent hydrolase